MRQVFEYSILCEMFETQRNPMDLVRITGGTLREGVLLLNAFIAYWKAEPLHWLANAG